MTERTTTEAAALHLNPVYPEGCGAPGITTTNHKDVECAVCLHRLQSATRLAVTFPRLKWVEENGLHAQLKHIQSEIREVWEAYFKPGSIEIVAEELVDVMQSAATALYIIERGYGLNLDDVAKAVMKKNKDRGYEQQNHCVE